MTKNYKLKESKMTHGESQMWQTSIYLLCDALIRSNIEKITPNEQRAALGSEARNASRY